MKPSRRPYFEIANPELPRMLEGLPRGLRVLDVGCGSGVHGAELQRVHGHRVVGVDLSAASIEKAKTRLAEAYVADVTRPDAIPSYGPLQFRRHRCFRHAGTCCRSAGCSGAALPLLAPGGYVLISLPNVAIWNVRLDLLFGRFEYQDTGTLDRTHMRFFTRRSFRRFLAEAGLEVSRNRITPGILRPFVPLIKRDLRQGVPDGPAGWRFLVHHGLRALSLLHALAVSHGTRHLPLIPGLFAFQLITLAQPVAHRNGSLDRRVGTSPGVSRGYGEKDARCSSLASV